MGCVGIGDVVVNTCSEFLKPINFDKKILLRNRTMRAGLKAISLFEADDTVSGDICRLNCTHQMIHGSRWKVLTVRQ